MNFNTDLFITGLGGNTL